MYNVSNEYKAAVYNTPICSKIEGTITLTDGNTIAVHTNTIVFGSLAVKNQCVSKQELELGCAYVGELDIAIYNDIDRNKLYDASIEISYYLQTGANTWEEIPLGVYTVTEATRAGKAVNIKAYDNMYMLDMDYNDVQTAGYPYEVLTYIATQTGITLAQSEEEIEGLTNGERYFTIAPTAGYNTYRDIISDIAAMLCSFATMTREGELKFIPYSTSVVDTIPASRRNSSSIAEKVIHYDGVKITLNGTVYTVLAEGIESSTNVLELETNQLIAQNNGTTYITGTLQALADAITDIYYTPCTFNTIGNPALDLGDLYRITTGNTTECNMLLMSYVWKYHGNEQVKSLGKTEIRGKSKTEKQVNNMSAAVASQELVIHTYENAREFTLNTDYKQIIRIDYVSQKAVKGMFNAQILIDVTCDSITDLQIRYVINQSIITTWQPVQVLSSGKHIVTLFYPLDIPENTVNSVRVQANITSGTATIAALGIKATVDAQGIVSGTVEWDGTIEIEETFTDIAMSGITVTPLEEVITAAVTTPTAGTVTQQFTAIELTGITIAGLTENITVIQEIPTE